MPAEQAGCVIRLLRIERNVRSLDRSLAFYQDALGFKTVPHPHTAEATVEDANLPFRSALLRLGDQHIGLTEFDPPGAPYPSDSKAADLWFHHIALVTTDMPAAHKRLERHNAIAITRDGPQHLPSQTGSVTAFKFRDPDLHPVELIYFPVGTGDPQWQRDSPAEPLIGIDHTAISVSDTAASVKFYCDLLGFRLISRQINHGVEQERLDGLEDDIVEVTALAPASEATPHLELLAYRTPCGRPAAMQPRDLASDRIILQVDDPGAILKRLMAALPNETLHYNGFSVWVRDPDGYLLCLTQ